MVAVLSVVILLLTVSWILEARRSEQRRNMYELAEQQYQRADKGWSETLDISYAHRKALEETKKIVEDLLADNKKLRQEIADMVYREGDNIACDKKWHHKEAVLTDRECGALCRECADELFGTRGAEGHMKLWVCGQEAKGQK